MPRARSGWVPAAASRAGSHPPRRRVVWVAFTTWRAADGLLSDNDVRAIHRDEDGILWLATGMGLTRLDLEQRRARFFYEKQGLSNNTLYTAIPDGPDLWISSNDGLTRFNRKTLSATRFHRGDGLQSSEFNFNAWLRTRAGDLLLGGNGGFNRLRTDRLGHPVPAPRLQLLYQADGDARLQPIPCRCTRYSHGAGTGRQRHPRGAPGAALPQQPAQRRYSPAGFPQ